MREGQAGTTRRGKHHHPHKHESKEADPDHADKASNHSHPAQGEQDGGLRKPRKR